MLINNQFLKTLDLRWLIIINSVASSSLYSYDYIHNESRTVDYIFAFSGTYVYTLHAFPLHHIIIVFCVTCIYIYIIQLQSHHNNYSDYVFPSHYSYNHVSDTGAERLGYALQHNRTLEGLQLWKNHITSEGAEGLSAGLVINSHLQWLGVSYHTYCSEIGTIQ